MRATRGNNLFGRGDEFSEAAEGREKRRNVSARFRVSESKTVIPARRCQSSSAGTCSEKNSMNEDENVIDAGAAHGTV